jgi:hypothetical protein
VVRSLQTFKIYPFGTVDLLDELNGQELIVCAKKVKQHWGDISRLGVTTIFEKS